MQEERELQRLRARLVEWRKNHKAPSRLPEDVWSGAAALATSLGVGRVSKALRLDYAVREFTRRRLEWAC